jgi:hypothetical protein
MKNASSTAGTRAGNVNTACKIHPMHMHTHTHATEQGRYWKEQVEKGVQLHPCEGSSAPPLRW